MAKKITKKRNISVANKKQGYWVNKDNLQKGERTIKAKGDKVLVKRNRSGYDYSRTFTGYELTKTELKKQFKQRSVKSQQTDLSLRAKTVETSPVLTAKQFFDFTKKDVEGIDTPKEKNKTLKETVTKNRKVKKEKQTSKDEIWFRKRSNKILEEYTFQLKKLEKEVKWHENYHRVILDERDKKAQLIAKEKGKSDEYYDFLIDSDDRIEHSIDDLNAKRKELNQFRFIPDDKSLTEKEKEFIKNYAESLGVKYVPSTNVKLGENLLRINNSTKSSIIGIATYNENTNSVSFTYDDYQKQSNTWKEKWRIVAKWDATEKEWVVRDGKETVAKELLNAGK